jgi:hypothetical protein
MPLVLGMKENGKMIWPMAEVLCIIIMVTLTMEYSIMVRRLLRG